MQYCKIGKLSIHFILSLILLLLACTPGQGQGSKTSDEKKKAKHKEVKDGEIVKTEFNINRWKSLLDNLIDEAKSIDKEKYPPVLAEIADAYWKLDKDKSSQLFFKALDAALEIDPKSKSYEPSINRVVSLATKRDQSLSKSLIKKIIELKEKNQKINLSPSSIALDFVNEDIKIATEVAEAGKAAGTSMDLAFLIFQLAKKDMNAANRIYLAYLLQLRLNQRIPLEQILYLGGFPLGYGEAYGGNIDITKMGGLGGMRIDGLVPNPSFIVKYLGIALLSVQQTVAEVDKLSAEEKEVFYTLALFATTYLLPEAELFTPNQYSLWLVIHQQLISNTSPSGQEKVARKIQEIKELRTRVAQHTSTQDYLDKQILTQLDQAEKLPDGCKRDQAYAKASLYIGAKNFPRSQAIAEQIKDISMRDNVLQYLYYDLAILAIKAANFEDAYFYSEKIKSLEQKTILYIRIAQKALEKGDEHRAREYLIDIGLLADKISSPSEQVTAWLAASAVFARFDANKTKEILYTAIRIGNKVPDQNIDTFSILRKVNLGCTSETLWYGSSDQAEKISLIQTLSTLSLAEPEEIVNLAYYIEDRTNRSRALAAIAKNIIENKMLKASTK